MSAASMGPGRLCRRSRPGPSYNQDFDRLGVRIQTEGPEFASNLLGMATERVEPGLLDRTSASSELGEDWRALTRGSTAIALITSPPPFIWFHNVRGESVAWSLFWTFITVIAFRGAIDLATRRLMPWPSLYGTDDPTLKEEDVIARRRVSFWRFWWKLVFLVFVLLTMVWFVRVL